MVASTEWCKTAVRPTPPSPLRDTWPQMCIMERSIFEAVWTAVAAEPPVHGDAWLVMCAGRQASQQQDASKEGRSWQPGWIDVLLMTLRGCLCVCVCVSGMGDKADSTLCLGVHVCVCVLVRSHKHVGISLYAFTGNASRFVERGRVHGKQSRAIHRHSFLLRSLSLTVKPNKRLEGLTHFVEKKLFLVLFFPGAHSVYH